MTERSEISLVDKDDDEGFKARVEELVGQVTSTPPENVHCMLVCVVSKEGEVKIGMLGDDENIAKMLTSVATIARNGVLQAHSPENNNDQTAH